MRRLTCEQAGVLGRTGASGRRLGRAQADPSTGEGFSVEIIHTNPQPDGYVTGDRLVFTYAVTNTTNEPRGLGITATSNLTDDQWCAWNRFPAGQTLNCADASRNYHVVTEADLETGFFVPTSTWNLHVGAMRESAVAESVDVVGDAVVLEAGTQPDPDPTQEPGEPAEPGEGFDAVRGTDPFHTDPQQLANNGEEGFFNYRIVALAVANNGDLLASYDGRPTAADSPGPNSIVQRRSTDNGRTWGQQTVIAQGKETAPIHGYSDPSYVIDRETGTIFNFHVYSMNVGFFGGQPGTDPDDRNIMHAAVSKSTDNGHTWTTEIITDQITPDLSWTSRFATSGNGIQLRYGQYAGRLIQNYPVRVGTQIQAVSVYSDDHGLTWQAGTPVGTAMDENKVVELSDGTVMMNSRDNSRQGFRKIALSADGGVTYGPVTQDTELIDPGNNASLIRAFPNAEQGSADAKILLFSNSASTTARVNGTVRMSCDDGETWPISRVFDPGGMAYSTLATQADGSIGLLYEPNEGFGGIAYSNFSLSWLSDFCVGVTAAPVDTTRGATVTVPVSIGNHGTATVSDASLTAEAPEGWTVVAGQVPTLAPGGQGVVTLEVTVPADAAYGRQLIDLTLTSAAGNLGGSAVVRVAPPADHPVMVTGRHVNPQDSYAVGDRLNFEFDVQSFHATSVGVYPTGATLEGFNPPAAPNCRYMSLGSDRSYTCTSAYHVVTEADLAAGEFAPATSWAIHENNTSGAVLTTITLSEPTVDLTPDIARSPPPRSRLRRTRPRTLRRQRRLLRSRMGCTRRPVSTTRAGVTGTPSARRTRRRSGVPRRSGPLRSRSLRAPRSR